MAEFLQDELGANETENQEDEMGGEEAEIWEDEVGEEEDGGWSRSRKDWSWSSYSTRAGKQWRFCLNYYLTFFFRNSKNLRVKWFQ